MPRRKVEWWTLGILLVCGCSSPLYRAQSPEPESVTHVSQPDPGTRFVNDFTVAWNTGYVEVKAVGLVTQLDGTGSDPPNSPLRDQLTKEMQTHDVKTPAQILESKDTSMVVVRGFIPPAANKGDVFDVEVLVPSRTPTTSLRGGWLMQCRLRETQAVDTGMLVGHILATAEGPLVIDALFSTADDKILLNRGRVLSGGIVGKARQLSLVIREEHSSVRTATLVSNAINDRFNTYNRGAKSGVANATRDNHIELLLHARYKNDIDRYLRVIGKIAAGERPEERVARLQVLERMLLEPTSAADAALQLEAIGADAVPILLKGIKSTDPEIRFYSAEVLAYLDENSGAEALYAAARDVHAFRWRALSALSVMDQFAAQERLLELTNEPSAETRYGAFRALRSKDSTDPVVRGELLGKQMWLHVLNSTGEPMVHFSRFRRPEIVVFGKDVCIAPPSFLYAGDKILIKAVNDEQVKITRFHPGKDPEHVICSTRVADIVRTIVQLGGTYTDVLSALHSAKQRRYLACRLEMDAVASPYRRYHREEETLASEEDCTTKVSGSHRVPDLFADALSRAPNPATSARLDKEPLDETPTEKGFFARMVTWWSD
jgi:hypothetical protein